MWKNDKGYNCLHVACENGAPPEVALAMIGIGGRSVVVATDNTGDTSLHWACCYGASLEVIDALLELGGRELALMMQEVTGWTALHSLCDNTDRHDDCVGAARALLVKGGRQLKRIKDDQYGRTPLDLAKGNKAPSEFITYLTKY